MLNEEDAIRAYCEMWNTGSVAPLEPLLSDAFVYTSQQVAQPMTSREEFLVYLASKLEAVRLSDATVFAEMGTYPAWRRPCAVLAQNDKANLVGVAFAKVAGGKLAQIDLCVAPSPHDTERSGEYPGRPVSDS